MFKWFEFVRCCPVVCLLGNCLTEQYSGFFLFCSKRNLFVMTGCFGLKVIFTFEHFISFDDGSWYSVYSGFGGIFVIAKRTKIQNTQHGNKIVIGHRFYWHNHYSVKRAQQWKATIFAARRISPFQKHTHHHHFVYLAFLFYCRSPFRFFTVFLHISNQKWVKQLSGYWIRLPYKGKPHAHYVIFRS